MLQVIGDELSQGKASFGCAVLEHRSALLGQHFFTRALEFRNGEQFRRGHPAGERDHVRPLCDLQEFADGGTLHGNSASCIPAGPSGFHGLLLPERREWVSFYETDPLPVSASS